MSNSSPLVLSLPLLIVMEEVAAAAEVALLLLLLLLYKMGPQTGTPFTGGTVVRGSVQVSPPS